MALYLIDGNSYVYRAYYAIRGLTDAKGRPTNAIYGFTTMLLKIIRERKPDGVIVVFDTPHPTDRHLMFEAYKAHRPDTPDDLIAQLPHIRRVIEAMNIDIFELPGYEADDVLATLADEAVRHKTDAFIVTSDKDMMQLVGPGIKVYDPMKDIEIDAPAVEAKLGVPPRRVVEYMALVGDASDNIPGIKGIGDKTARELMTEFRSLDELIAHPERIKRDRIRKLVVEGKDDMLLSLKLAQINRKVPIDIDRRGFKMRTPKWDELAEIFSGHGFNSLIKLIPKDTGASEKHGLSLTAIRTMDELTEYKRHIKTELALDTEATGLDPLRAGLVGFSLCMESGTAVYVPLAHEGLGTAQIALPSALRAIKHVLGDSAVTKIGHNIKYDIQLLHSHGVEISGPLFDTMIASSLLNPNRNEHSLESVGLEYLGRRKRSFKEVAGMGGFQMVEIDEATRYAAEDAELAFELKAHMIPLLKEQGLERAFYDIELPLIPVLADMERVGIKVSTEVLGGIGKELGQELDSLRERIYFIAGGEFNINSPKQLGEVLFDRLGLKPGKKKKTGYSTDVSVLEELSKSHELPAEILTWRTLSKLKNTYVDVLPGLINPATGRLHTSFNQASTATGRLSSSEPNLQNIPVRGDWGRRIREAFIAEPGCVIVSADYSQIELRILGHLSGDETLSHAFSHGADIHTRTASEIFDTPARHVTADMRRVAKTVNFGVIYGMSAYGLSESLGISRQQAEAYIRRYFERHPGVRHYIDNLIADAKKHGFVTTMWGRRRPVPELHSHNANIRQAGERLAVNTPIQGSAADIIKMAMIRLHERIRAEGLKGRMILQVHDELVFEVPLAEADRFALIVREEMEGAVSLSIPLHVELGTADNWAGAH